MNPSQLLETLTGSLALAWALVVLPLLLIATVHVLLRKRDARAAAVWLGFIWLLPMLGLIMYYLLGINRIQRRATRLRRSSSTLSASAEIDDEQLERIGYQFHGLVRTLDRIGRMPLTSGNSVELLDGGQRAYAEMLDAIDKARQRVCLLSYIFDDDEVGYAFCAALARAAGRGVEVAVLIDAAGLGRLTAQVCRRLSAAQVPVRVFHPLLISVYSAYFNLRNHRKLLVVDAEIGFTGGMNITADSQRDDDDPKAVIDCHFRVQGPVVAWLEQIFLEDWASTGTGLPWQPRFSNLPPDGPVLARAVPDGPDDDFGHLHTMLLSAFNSARREIRILNPYFLPDNILADALRLAALRGVRVEILIPESTDLRLVTWATLGLLWQVLECGCEVWRIAPPFDHSKLIVIDGEWVTLGSTNLDPRSLRLNFELNIECYDRALAAEVGALMDSRRARATRMDAKAHAQRSLPLRLRDAIARLAHPYL